MAIAAMTKVLLASHKSEAAALLEQLQQQGILQVLNAQEAMISKEWPELLVEDNKARNIEDIVIRLERGIRFLKTYTAEKGGLLKVLAPLTVIEQKQYSNVVTTDDALKLLEEAEKCEKQIDHLLGELESNSNKAATLEPWKELAVPVEQFSELQQASAVAGFLTAAHFEETLAQISSAGAVVEKIGLSHNRIAVVVAVLKENFADVQKILRTADFEHVSFEEMQGTPAEMLKEINDKIEVIKNDLQEQRRKAHNLAKERLKLCILFDHYHNLLGREWARTGAPGTEHSTLFEGWVRKKDLLRLKEIVTKYPASNVIQIEPAADEQVPVDIENKRLIRPFEVITRLYGMPQYFEVDPTSLLAPFFAIFFALCLSDAGYGLIIIALSSFFIWKMQGDKKLMWLLLVCSLLAIGAGAITGGWFGSGLHDLAVMWNLPVVAHALDSAIWFDPLKEPMTFFKLAIALGYIQIIVGLSIGFIHNLRRKEFAAAICDQLTWIVMLNSIAIWAGSKMGLLPHHAGSVSGWISFIPAMGILFFSQREGTIATRLAMGAYSLFSTIFYLGDILSYLRLMALGMASGGVAMAINVLAKTVRGIPYVGLLFAIVLLVVGHIGNTLMSALGAFVHTMRLQFVEYFPKFLIGGGKEFTPLKLDYKHVKIMKN
ncbi:MAG: V-type ATP synthase subunit I [Planctomycetota bacterium]